MYKIVIEKSYINIYANFDFKEDVESAIKEIENIAMLLLDIIYKLEERPLNIKNVVFTRSLESINNEKLEEKYNVNAIADNGVGLALKKEYNSSSNIIINSYFLEDNEIKNFVKNPEKSVERLYNVWI